MFTHVLPIILLTVCIFRASHSSLKILLWKYKPQIKSPGIKEKKRWRKDPHSGKKMVFESSGKLWTVLTQVSLVSGGSSEMRLAKKGWGVVAPILAGVCECSSCLIEAP